MVFFWFFFVNKGDFLKIINLYIQTFDIKEIGHIDVNIHGLGPLDWILGTVVGFVADLIRDFLADFIALANGKVPLFPSLHPLDFIK